MMRTYHRRDFIKRSAVSTSLVGLGGLSKLAEVTAAEPGQELLRVDPALDPLVRMIYESPREDVIPRMLQKVQAGLPYRTFLSATFLASIRYRLGSHGVFAAHSVNQLALHGTHEDRLLPLFWYLHVLRSRVRSSTKFSRVPENRLPRPEKAASLFEEAMQAEDRETATLALIALGRDVGPKPAFAKLWPFAAGRNQVNGGHTAISVSNAYRTLQTVGWQHATPVFHFLVPPCSVEGKGHDEQEANRRRAQAIEKLPADWATNISDRGAVLELLAVFRKGNPGIACQLAFDQLRTNKLKAGSIWDAVFLLTAELFVRYRWTGPNGGCGHSVTCTNALHFSYRANTYPATRLFILLEAVEWATTFLRRERARNHLRDLEITRLEPTDLPASESETVEQIFSLLPPRRFFHWSRSPRKDQDRAMRLTYSLACQTDDHRLLLRTAHRYLCLKATNEAHDLKYPIALLENYQHASRCWKPHLLSALVHYLHGPQMEDSEPMEQLRSALGQR